MALVLTIREGSDFYAADKRFVVTQVIGRKKAVVVRESDQKEFTLTDERSVELMDGVRASVGNAAPPAMIRIAVEAARSIVVLRGDKFRKGPVGHDDGDKIAS